MQYSFNHWHDRERDPASDTAAGETDLAPGSQAFPFSDDLEELERTLSMSLAEGMAARYRLAEPTAAPEDDDWQDWARTVAGYVLSCLEKEQAPIRAEIDALQQQVEEARQQAEAYLRDNRLLAQQIQTLQNEREELINRADLAEAYAVELVR